MLVSAGRRVEVGCHRSVVGFWQVRLTQTFLEGGQSRADLAHDGAYLALAKEDERNDDDEEQPREADIVQHDNFHDCLEKARRLGTPYMDLVRIRTGVVLERSRSDDVRQSWGERGRTSANPAPTPGYRCPSGRSPRAWGRKAVQAMKPEG